MLVTAFFRFIMFSTDGMQRSESAKFRKKGILRARGRRGTSKEKKK